MNKNNEVKKAKYKMSAPIGGHQNGCLHLTNTEIIEVKFTALKRITSNNGTKITLAKITE